MSEFAPITNRTPLRIRLLSRLVADPSGCLLWTGKISKTGYGVVSVNNRSRLVHRVMYEMFAGPIPAGMQLDHLCKVRHCANISHLEPVTCRVNLLRGDTFQARNAAKTHCDNGHEFTEANTYRRPGRRACRTCRRVAGRAYKQRKRAAA